MPEIRMPIGAGTPPTPATNEVSLYAKPDKRFYMQDDTGTEVKILTNETTLTDLTVNLPLTSTGGSTPNVSINPATTVTAGSLSAADKTKLDDATATTAINTLVLRDGSGNFSAGTITADLTGTADTCVTIPALSGDITTNGVTNVTSIGAGVIVNADISPSAAIDNSKLATNPLLRSNHSGTQDAGSTLTGLGTAVDAHLTGTAPIVDAMIAAGAAIANTKLATNPLLRSNHSGTQLHDTISDWDAEVDARIPIYLAANPIVNAQVDASAAIALSKLAQNPLDRSLHTGTQIASTISDFATAVDNALTAGNGIDITTGTVSAVGTSNRISVGGGTIDIDAAYVGQTSITTLGFVTAGTWNATEVEIAYGGTGANNAADAHHNLTDVTSYAVNTNLTAADSIVIVDSSGGTRTIGLPAADQPYRFTIKRVGANTVTIDPNLTETVDGAATLDLTADYDFVTVVSDGTGVWYVVATS